MNSLSVGVRSVFSEVNCLSKLLTSLRCCCTNKNKLFQTFFKNICNENTYNFWLKRWLHFAILYLLPIDTPEKCVASHIVFAAHSASQSLARILREKLQQTKFARKLKTYNQLDVYIIHIFTHSNRLHFCQKFLLSVFRLFTNLQSIFTLNVNRNIT